LNYQSYDRMYAETAERERQSAKRAASASSSGAAHQKKWQKIRASLENFIPEVRPGNQTALSTRAHPFALYIAQMHQNIHQLWGYGFLPDMDNKPARHPMNDMSLWVMIEIVLRPDGSIAKATVARTSGALSFDVAALDTVFSAAPYPPPPSAIRSADGNVYLHWRFHRDHRQCGTFGVDPFILTTPPKSLLVPPAVGGGTEAQVTLEHFSKALQQGDVQDMTKRCGLPFRVQGQIVASSHQELRRMFVDLIGEVAGSPRQKSQFEVMTMMQARRQLGYLPAGAEYGNASLLGKVKVGSITMLLSMQKRAAQWLITGLSR
jgi:TonB family protein